MGSIRFAGFFLLLFASATARGQTASTPATAQDRGRLAGIVMETSSGTSDVVVFLCDQSTGLPVLEEQSGSGGRGSGSGLPALRTALSDERGRFAFEDLPAGEYRVVAQKWTGPYRGAFELHGSVIQLFGWKNSIRVPSPEAEKTYLRPAGDGILVFDQEVGNSETLLVLGMNPPAHDPVLGLSSLGRQFLGSVIGFNRMPYGRTTVLGLPPGERVHAFFFAPDNLPGAATAAFEAGRGAPEERVPFVAAWSDGRRNPPPPIAGLQERVAASGLRLGDVISSVPGARARTRMPVLRDELHDVVTLPDQTTATLGDLLAAEAYEQLQKPSGARAPRRR